MITQTLHTPSFKIM